MRVDGKGEVKKTAEDRIEKATNHMKFANSIYSHNRRRRQIKTAAVSVIPAQAGISSFCDTLVFNQPAYFMIAKGGYVYILSNKSRTILYIGVTSMLRSRVLEHRESKFEDCFTSKYNCYYLIYYEFYDSIEAAIDRETQLKRWKRQWKENLIKGFNPQLKDLFDQVDD